MHYRNGREAKNGDKVVQLSLMTGQEGQIITLGVLRDATPGNDYCNGHIVQEGQSGHESSFPTACLCDCLHVEDVAAILAEKGLDKRPAGK